jgi:DNA-binding transcriptional regulator YiaG
VRTLRGWEQGAHKPRGPARLLLVIADKHPDVIRAALRESMPTPR